MDQARHKKTGSLIGFLVFFVLGGGLIWLTIALETNHRDTFLIYFLYFLNIAYYYYGIVLWFLIKDAYVKFKQN